MTVPLMVLAALSVVGGLVNTPFRLTLEHFLEPAFEGIDLSHPPEGLGMFAVLAAISVLAGTAGVVIGYLTYNRPPEMWQRFQDGFGRVWGLWEQAYKVDDVYGATLVKPGKALADAAAFKVDVPIVDGAVNGVGWVVRRLGSTVRLTQTGLVRTYGVVFVAGVLGVIIWMVVAGGGI
jgi:NADH-quinone oxidoreductase subunit L